MKNNTNVKNKKFLLDMFSRSPQTTLGIKKVVNVNFKKGEAEAVYLAKKNMCHSGNIVQGGFITGWLDAIMALACMCKEGSDVLVLSLEIKTSFLKSVHPGDLIVKGKVISKTITEQKNLQDNLVKNLPIRKTKNQVFLFKAQATFNVDYQIGE